MVLDKEETKNSLFGGLKESSTPTSTSPKTKEVPKSATSNLPKWRTLEKVTVLLTNQQRDAVEDLARTIMRHRSSSDIKSEDRERITANTVVRALIDNLIETIPQLKIEDIRNEDELKSRLQSVFRK